MRNCIVDKNVVLLKKGIWTASIWVYGDAIVTLRQMPCNDDAKLIPFAE